MLLESLNFTVDMWYKLVEYQHVTVVFASGVAAFCGLFALTGLIGMGAAVKEKESELFVYGLILFLLGGCPLVLALHEAYIHHYYPEVTALKELLTYLP